MNISYLYIIECKNGSLYTGITGDLSRRYRDHLAGKGSKYCRAFKVRVIKMAWQFTSKKTGLISLENIIQKLTKERKLDLISNPQNLNIYIQELGLDLNPLSININDFLKDSCPCSKKGKCKFHGICSQCLEVHLNKLKKPPECFTVKAKWIREVAQNLKLQNLYLLEERTNS